MQRFSRCPKVISSWLRLHFASSDCRSRQLQMRLLSVAVWALLFVILDNLFKLQEVALFFRSLHSGMVSVFWSLAWLQNYLRLIHGSTGGAAVAWVLVLQHAGWTGELSVKPFLPRGLSVLLKWVEVNGFVQSRILQLGPIPILIFHSISL